MRKDLHALYQAVIMRHNREPYHYEKRPEAEVVIEAYNPLCGDQYKLYLNIRDGRVQHAHFYGYGCAISKASTSVLIEKLEGLRIEEIPELAKRFIQVVTPEATPPADVDEKMAAFAAARQFPARLQCATLSWEALLKYLENRKTEKLKN
jgi:nitrogen fixation NifU-like protein